MGEIRTIRVEVYSGEKYDAGWPPSNGLEFLSWITSKIESVPEEFRGAVEIDIESETQYESSQATIDIYYDRPENNADKAEREDKRSRYEELNKRQELKELNRLKQKYGQ